MKNINAYIDVENETFDPVIFQKKWFVSVQHSLNMIVKEDYNKVKSVQQLTEIRDSFNIISQNINEKLPGEEQVLLRNIFSTSIHVLNSAIKTRDFSKVAIVGATISTLVE
jgi:hypothetical protein